MKETDVSVMMLVAVLSWLTVNEMHSGESERDLSLAGGSRFVVVQRVLTSGVSPPRDVRRRDDLRLGNELDTQRHDRGCTRSVNMTPMWAD
jgi:hypothetical protein